MSGPGHAVAALLLASGCLALPTLLTAPALAPWRTDALIGRLLRASPEIRTASLADLSAAAAGLSVWRRALGSGRVPDYEGVDADQAAWPPEPLLSALSSAMGQMDMPRTTARHPSLIPAALEAVLAAAVRFEAQAGALADDPAAPTQGLAAEAGDDAAGGWGGDEQIDEPDASGADLDLGPVFFSGGAGAEDGADGLGGAGERAELAHRIAHALVGEWGPSLRGVAAIGKLGGSGSDAGASTAEAGSSFSPRDGLWAHDGWRAMETIQTKLRQLAALSDLFRELGQRPAADGDTAGGPGAAPDSRAAPSAAFSPLAPRQIAGLCRTGELARVAPVELALLAGGRGGDTGGGGAEEGDTIWGHQQPDGLALSRARRRLFLARLSERRLLGYALEGWEEAVARPVPRRRARLPRARGGPLVVCLDTSHSMTGGREQLAKAVVLEAVRSAHSAGRPCLLFAFSGASDLAELRLTPPPRRRRPATPARASLSSRPTPRGAAAPTSGRATRRAAPNTAGGATDRASLKRLLDFLAHSFGGGTDVAGPLKRALDVLESPARDEIQFSGADLLLVSDGELPDPPLDPHTAGRLRALQAGQGFQVHGLLIGKPRPTPLDQMCDQVHTCLSDFDPLAVLRRASEARAAAAAVDQGVEATAGVRGGAGRTGGGGGASISGAYEASISGGGRAGGSGGAGARGGARVALRTRAPAMSAAAGGAPGAGTAAMAAEAEKGQGGARRTSEGPVGEGANTGGGPVGGAGNTGGGAAEVAAALRLAASAAVSSRLSVAEAEAEAAEAGWESSRTDTPASSFAAAAVPFPSAAASPLNAAASPLPNTPPLISTPPLPTASPLFLASPRPALRAAAAAIESGLVERSTEARLLLLALCGREHLLFLGPPGTAKSELCRRLSLACGLAYFERTLTRFSTPEELFGPLSLAALERDEFRRATRGYAPEAELLFVDEVFKASSAILNTLLTILNERLFDDGAGRVLVPLRTAVAASNEGPETDELDALYDRFLLRRIVSPVSDDGVMQMLLDTTGVPPVPPTATPAQATAQATAAAGGAERMGGRGAGGDRGPAGSQNRPAGPQNRPAGPEDGIPGKGSSAGADTAGGVTDAAGGGADTAGGLRAALAWVDVSSAAVSLPRHVALLLRDARAFVRDSGGADGLGGGYVSDRRLRRTAGLLRASAAAHGRGEVSVADVAAVLPHVLWGTEDEAGPVAAWVEEKMVPEGGVDQLGFLLESVRARARARAEGEGWPEGMGAARGGRVAREGEEGAEAEAAWEAPDATLLADVSALADAALESAAEMLSHAISISSMREHLFLPPHTASALRQRLLPETLRKAEALRGIAAEAAALRMAMQADSPADAVLALLDEPGGGGRTIGDGSEWDGDEGGGEAAGGGFSEEQLAWGRKEAKARLSAETFREWRKAVKKVN